jgi:hypothetical protein
VTWLSITVACGVALSQVGILAAVAVLVALIFAAGELAGWRRVQRALDARRREEELREHRCRRETRVQAANVSVHELRLLADLVRKIDPEEVVRYELDDLLDRYAELAIAHARCDEAMRSLDHAAAARTLDAVGNDGTSAARRAVLERQLQCWKGRQQQARCYHEEMLAIAELVKLIAARTASPDTSMEAGEIERRLAQLDDEDAAHRELGA